MLYEITDASTTSYTDSYNKTAGETYVYSITVKYADGESSSSNQGSVYFEPEAIYEIADDAAFVLFSNPVKPGDILNLKSNETIESIRIVDLSGKTIKKANNSHGIKVIETNDIKPGVYLIQIYSGNFGSTDKLIITE